MSTYIPPYIAIGLTSKTTFIQHRNEIPAIIDEIEALADSAIWLASEDGNVKLITLIEGGLQGFPDETQEMDPDEYIKNIAIDIENGQEVLLLGSIAKKHKIYLAFQARTIRKEFPNRYFNEDILLNPQGEVILRSCKNSTLYPCEPSTTPHDVYDQWVELYGDNLDAFYPVAKTEIGNIGFAMAMEGSYPEYVRGLAMNGAELILRMNIPEPFADASEIQNRAHALNNTVYVLGNQSGVSQTPYGPVALTNGKSQLIDYKGRIVAEKSTTNVSFLSGEVNIEALREYRINTPIGNWIKDLRCEIITKIYEKPNLPKNINKDRTTYTAGEYATEIMHSQVHNMIDRGIFTPPNAEDWESRVYGYKKKQS
ncbi:MULTISPECIES: nitrilase-related carbon-nitrogen hydrolase [Gammaproteobacteria]|uniref:nitrilase-related carbon-nitrogen hydrolase n=1 Tax=Gammaproteobacteria TaxID=1236 RepID=UPI000C84A573|nr:nitrilase-related carbon-nitrogen hydrolase [Vibrio breoganii]PMO36370.1 hypothetical protein BCT12_08265 [Vibrio breoganii]